MVFKSQRKNRSLTNSCPVTDIQPQLMELSRGPLLHDQQSEVMSRELGLPPRLPFAFWSHGSWWSASLLFLGSYSSSDNSPTDVSPAFILLTMAQFCTTALFKAQFDTNVPWNTYKSVPPAPLLETLKDTSAKPSWAIMRSGFSWARARGWQNLNQ